MVVDKTSLGLLFATSHHSTLMFCSFTKQVLAQHELFRNKETKECKADAVSETGVFVSSTGNFSITALVHMHYLKNFPFVANIEHFQLPAVNSFLFTSQEISYIVLVTASVLYSFFSFKGDDAHNTSECNGPLLNFTFCCEAAPGL